MVGACQVWGTNWSGLYGKWEPCKSAPLPKSSRVKVWDRPNNPNKNCSFFCQDTTGTHTSCTSSSAAPLRWTMGDILSPIRSSQGQGSQDLRRFTTFFWGARPSPHGHCKGSDPTAPCDTTRGSSRAPGMEWWDGGMEKEDMKGNEGKIPNQLHQQREGTLIKIQVSVLVLNFGWF